MLLDVANPAGLLRMGRCSPLMGVRHSDGEEQRHGADADHPAEDSLEHRVMANHDGGSLRQQSTAVNLRTLEGDAEG